MPADTVQAGEERAGLPVLSVHWRAGKRNTPAKFGLLPNNWASRQIMHAGTGYRSSPNPAGLSASAMTCSGVSSISAQLLPQPGAACAVPPLQEVTS